jgi:predicted XRE-type DNA-binding protein
MMQLTDIEKAIVRKHIENAALRAMLKGEDMAEAVNKAHDDFLQKLKQGRENYIKECIKAQNIEQQRIAESNKITDELVKRYHAKEITKAELIAEIEVLRGR